MAKNAPLFFLVNRMSYLFPSDLQQLVEAHLSSGRYSTEDDVLRDALRALAEEDQDLQSVRESIDEWKAGDAGTSLADVFDRVRGCQSDGKDE
jgi:putative addiction module CopG family antidote